MFVIYFSNRKDYLLMPTYYLLTNVCKEFVSAQSLCKNYYAIKYTFFMKHKEHVNILRP